MKVHLLFKFIVILLMSIQFSFAQNLNKGDLAFVGFNTDSPDAFSWIALKEIPPNEVIYFSDQGWTGSAWFVNTERHITWTAPAGGLSCGTIVRINGTNATSGTYTGTFPSLSAGDQVIAYQGNAPATASPTFLAAVHGDYNSADYDAATTWNNGGSTINGSASQVPTGLTNGTDCVSLFLAPGPEIDNAKYNIILTGTNTVVRASINDPGNWTSNDATAISIEPSDYTISVNCIALPVELVQFNVRLIEEGVSLEWQTASETNNRGFSIERIDENGKWKTIGFEEGQGSSTIQNSYTFHDEDPYYGINYYRLKQIDFDEEFEYSEIRTIHFGKRNLVCSIYPNPTRSSLVQIDIPIEATEVFIFDNNGRLKYKNTLSEGTHELSLPDLITGLYSVRFIYKGKIENQSLVIFE